jgi:hypothetical protein
MASTADRFAGSFSEGVTVTAFGGEGWDITSPYLANTPTTTGMFIMYIN